jgi:MFS family permease
MGPGSIARLVGRRVHYAWIVVAVMFFVTLAGVGVRATPGVLIVPLEQAFGWSNAAISGAIALNFVLFGLTGPFAAALVQTLGLRRTVMISMVVLALGAGLSSMVTQLWQLYLTWGVLVGAGTGGVSMGVATAVANRWFMQRRGLVLGLLTASNATGQLIFLPVLAWLASHVGWHVAPLAAALVLTALIPFAWLLLPESPGALGMAAYGSTEVVDIPKPSGNPFFIALSGLARGSRSVDFWLLFITFSICGFSTFGLVATHLIPFCIDHGIPAVTAASLLAAMGVFDLVGTTVSGWLTDRYNPRVLLFWYYGLRGLSLAVLPFTSFDVVSLGIFAMFYGLDWVATVPPTITLTNDVFGRKDAPVLVSWIVAGHQVGSAVAAFGAGETRFLTGSYVPAFLASGVACLLAALLVLRIAKQPVALAVAE